MDINSNWNFIELVDNLKMLKQDYDEWIASFLCCKNSVKIVNQYVKYMRDKFYSLNLKEWQIDKCWEYMNNDICYNDLYYIIKKTEKNRQVNI